MENEAGSPAPNRLGEPSPLTFHLAAALAGYQGALLAAPRALDPRFPWAPHLRSAAAALGGEPDRLAVAQAIGTRLSEMIRGLEHWQRHPFRRSLADPPAIWARGGSRLLDFGDASGGGKPVLVVPSLINRAYILDLLPERSLLRWLASTGFRPYLLDWGDPGLPERDFDLEAYGADRLLPALDLVRARAGAPVSVLGYCMGGTLAAGLAARRPGSFVALATIGAPWRFEATAGIAGSLRAMLRAERPERAEALIDSLAEVFGYVPVLVLQTLFALINPMQAAVKFRRFARLDQESAAARHFVALEDWLADGVPMARGAAKDLLVEWQIRNRPARGEWHFLGGPVRLEAIRSPTLAFCGSSDSIAPPLLSRPLPEAISGARIVAPPTGHVGMIVGSAAPGQVWRPLAEFLHAHAG